MTFRVLLVAKAPVAGLAKTRLAARVGPEAAARIAAASLLDTLETCALAVGPAHCHLALAGDLDAAVQGGEVRRMLRRWRVRAQSSGTFAERLAAAHRHVEGPRVQIGMDTPQVTADLLGEVASGLADHDAVLAPAEDGGWWALGARGPSIAAPLVGVPMSRPTTYADTSHALRAAGYSVGPAARLRDVDEVEDLLDVARRVPGSRFAEAVEGALGEGEVA